MKRRNEANAIAALMGVMPFLTGCKYQEGGSPDDSTSSYKEVDFLLYSDSGKCPKLAVEHTKVEAFRGQVTYVNRSYEIVEEINRLCLHKLPEDRYFILVPPSTLVDTLRKRATVEFQTFIVPWIINTAASLRMDKYATVQYKGFSVLLQCGGSHPDINGTVGRIPGSPDDQANLAKQSLWHSIAHGLGKFPKYKELGYDTVLSLENISGAVHPSMLLEIEREQTKRSLISSLIDFIVVFASNEDRMIVGTVWKEREARFDLIPYNRRFHKVDGHWEPMG